MTDCLFCQRLLQEFSLPELPEGIQLHVANHLADCSDCMAQLERSVLMEAAIAGGMADIPKPEVRRGWRWTSARGIRFRAIRAAALTAAMLAAFALGAWLGLPLLHPWRLTGVGAAPIRPEYALFGIPSISRTSVTNSRLIGPWKVKGDLANGFASLDDHVSHSSGRSIKLVQRSGSGELQQDIPIPLPAGADITVGAWILAPRGGSADNKYLEVFVRPSNSSAKASSFVLDASPNWRPVILRTTLEKPTNSFLIDFSVANGYGNYLGWDWATWVDDIFIGVLIHMEGHFVEDHGELVIDAKLPPGYTADMVEKKSIVFNAYDERAREIAGSELATSHSGTVRLAIKSPVAVRAMRTPNRDTGWPPSAWVFGRLRYHQYSIPFQIGIHGYAIKSSP